jgi:steroid 5-alpha reductase family enzyme
MENNWAVFTTLLIVCLFAGFVNFLNPFRFLEAKNNDTLLIPQGVSGMTMNVWNWVFTSLAIILGVILGFTSLAAYREKNADPSKALMGIGGTILILMLLPMFAAIVKGFGDGTRFPRLYNWFNDNFTTTRIIVGIIACIVFGVPLVVRGKQIEDKMNDDTISKEDKTQLSNDLALSSANTLLSIGLILQIVGFAIVAYWIWQNNNLANSNITRIGSGILTALLLILGPILITGSQKNSNIYFNKAETEQSSFENKPLLAHGIIYLIIGFVFGLLLLGSFLLTQTTFYKGGFGVLIIAFLVFISVSIGYVIDETSEKNNLVERSSPYYEQLKAEVTKDLNKNKLAGADVTTEQIDGKMKERYRANINTPNHAIMGVFYTLSIVIVVFILMFYNIRLKLAQCGKIPNSFSLWDAVSYVFRTPDNCTAVLAAAGTDLSSVNPTYPEKVKQDKMLSSDWDAILSNKNNTDKNFSQMFVRFAKWFSLIPFLSVILIIMWVSILFTNITTSPRTSDWIANTFTGDMFPRVKELIDTFFIVLIVGLLLCAILLLPIVKELNVGGLDSILKFAESIQVWQYQAQQNDGVWKRIIAAVIGFCAVAALVLSGWWTYLLRPNKQVGEPNIPDNWEWYIAFAGIFALCSIPAWYHGIPGGEIGGSPTDPNFEKESIVTRGIRLLLTTIYLIPWLIVTIFKVILYGVGSLTGVESIKEKFNEELDKLDFTKWTSKTDLRMFPLDDKPITPASVTSIAAVAPAAAPAVGAAPPASSEPVGIDETKVSAIGKLIKVILLTISFVILILSVIYYVYKIDATNRAGGTDQDVAKGGFVAQMNSPTAHTIYVIMAIVAIAGFVAHLREKFKSANAEKSPEDYLFNDVKPEDANSPMRQLTFALTHIIYIVLMIIVWVYDRDVDDKNRMSVTGMTVLGIAIILFHYGLEFMDNRLPREPGAGANTASASEPPKMAPLRNLLSNVRFIMNTVFFIVLCALAYYKQHGVMVALIVFMFLFHLTKSILGLKLLKFLWACILYIPCLFLDFLQSSQSAVGDTTRPIWIIVAIELLLIAILYGGPYLLNYIGASASQMVGAPVPLNPQYDTELTTQSPKVFIFHNTGMDRTPEDKAANCPVEEKKRYHYAISGWFLLNNSVSTKNQDLEIFNFGDTPKMTYNPYSNELKLTSTTVNITTGNSEVTEVYNSRIHYKALTAAAAMAGSAQRKAKFQMLTEDDEIDADIPLQRWNYFVVNYDGKTMDLFLNNKLINRSEFIMPDIQLKPITVGTENGLNGNMCNFAFHKYPLTKEQIRWTYTMLKSQNPPMIGTKTIKDELKEAGTTTMYTR